MTIADFTFDEPPQPAVAPARKSTAAKGSTDIVARLAEIVAVHRQRRAVVDEEGSLL
jgi:hypothetical protein